MTPMPNTDNLGELREKLASTKTFNYDMYCTESDRPQSISVDEALDEITALFQKELEAQVERARWMGWIAGSENAFRAVIVHTNDVDQLRHFKPDDLREACLNMMKKQTEFGERQIEALTNNHKEEQPTRTKPCTWCEREDQETCPDCEGTGFVEEKEGEES